MIGVRMPRKSKYHAKPVVIDSIRFASKREARRYAELLLLARAGEINGLQLQPEFPFELNGTKLFSYYADFSYCRRDGARVVEDAKGVSTPLYRLKKKIIEALYGIEIVEV